MKTSAFTSYCQCGYFFGRKKKSQIFTYQSNVSCTCSKATELSPLHDQDHFLWIFGPKKYTQQIKLDWRWNNVFNRWCITGYDKYKPFSAISNTTSRACTSIVTRAPSVILCCLVSLPLTSATILFSCFFNTSWYSYNWHIQWLLISVSDNTSVQFIRHSTVL